MLKKKTNYIKVTYFVVLSPKTLQTLMWLLKFPTSQKFFVDISSRISTLSIPSDDKTWYGLTVPSGFHNGAIFSNPHLLNVPENNCNNGTTTETDEFICHSLKCMYFILTFVWVRERRISLFKFWSKFGRYQPNTKIYFYRKYDERNPLIQWFI